VRQLKKWIADPVENVFLQVPRALVASVLAALLNLGTVIGLVETLGLHPLAAAAVGYLVGGVLQYMLCLVWIFPATPGNHARGFVQFMLLSLIGLPVAEGVMLVAPWLHVAYPLAVVASQAVTFSWNFASRRLLLFRSTASLRTESRQLEMTGEA
jgi:putative flippase GtrA